MIIDNLNLRKDEGERNREMEKTSEQLQKDVDLFLANKGEIKEINNIGEPASINQTLEIEKLARNWIGNCFPKKIAMYKAKKLGIDFKLVIAERERRIARSRKS